MEIPLAPSNNKDIYSFGFDSGLNRAIPNNSTGVVYDTVNQTNTGSVVTGGNLTLKTLSIGGLVRQVAPGDDIQAAIDAINREGGGTVQLLEGTYLMTQGIELKSNVTLAGAGRDITILDFEDRVLGIKATGTASSIVQNFQILALTVKNAGNAAGVDIQFSDFWKIENVRVTSCPGATAGTRVQTSQNFILSNIRFDSNTGAGLLVYADANSNRFTENWTMVNCFAELNTGSGFEINGSNGTGSAEAIRAFTCIQCTSESNTADGWDIFGSTAGGASSLNTASFVSCFADSNGGHGFDIQASETIFTNCVSTSNTGDGFQITDDAAFIGCKSTLNGINWNVDDSEVSIVGAQYALGDEFTDNFSSLFGSSGVTSTGSNHESPVTERKIWYMGTGDGLRAGDVVVWQPSARGTLATTTITNGDNKVVGAAVKTSNNIVPTPILTNGYTGALLVNNSAASISIGDYLSTYSHAYHAKKAVTGDMVFAIALEAPTTSTAQIDALLISPRLI